MIYLLLSCFCISSSCSLARLAPLEAVLFDVDGTLCDSDPIHHLAFREMLQEVEIKLVLVTFILFLENINDAFISSHHIKLQDGYVNVITLINQ